MRTKATWLPRLMATIVMSPTDTPSDGDLAYARLLVAAELLAIDFYRRALASKKFRPRTTVDIEQFTSAISAVLLLLPEYLWFGRQQIRAMRQPSIRATPSLPR